MSTKELGERKQTQNSKPVCTEREEGTQREAEMESGKGVMEMVRCQTMEQIQANGAKRVARWTGSGLLHGPC